MTPSTGDGPAPPSTVHRLPCGSAALRAYFSSGWAFFIPYLLLYLLYAWQKWPANAVGGGPWPVISDAVTSGQLAVTGDRPPSTDWIPPLLYVYWTLHVAHLALGIIALRSWWKAATPPASSLTPYALRGSAAATALRAVTPWLLLTLLFAIPGVYLEWPSDPWEHLRRITEWQTHATVGSHSAGYKSFYFFAYSWVGWLSSMHLLSWLEVYYVGICLLLAWQYYLLAKAVGLDRRWAFLFVVVNALTFGNSVFSFYRYYGISSSIFAQLGAVALTRIALEYAKGLGRGAARHRGRSTVGSGQKTESGDQSPVGGPAEQSCAMGDNQEGKAAPRGIPRALTALRSALAPLRAHSAPYSLPATRYSLLRLAAASFALLLLIAFNHFQGLGIAGLGVAAILVWRLIEWKRSMILWLAAAAVVLSVATVLWWPRHPNIDSVFQHQGWLNAWYGFDLYSPGSGASDRMMQILGLFGLFNSVAAIFLLWRNDIVGWLTIGPVLALSLPLIAIPFANSVASTQAEHYIITYHRMFFAVPGFLAIAACLHSKAQPGHPELRSSGQRFRNSLGSGYALLLLGLAAAIVTPPRGRYHNRSLHALACSPDDLNLKAIWRTVESHAKARDQTQHSRIVALSATGHVIELQHAGKATVSYRFYGSSSSSPSYDLRVAKIAFESTTALRATSSVLVDPLSFFTAYSWPGLCSGHWSPQETVLAAAGSNELQRVSDTAGVHAVSDQ